MEHHYTVLYIPSTPVAFPLVGSRAEKSEAWMDQTVMSTIIYSLFNVDPVFTVSHSKPRSNSLLAMCYHPLPCTSTPTVQPHCQLGLITENKSWKKPQPQLVFSPSKAWSSSCCSWVISNINTRERMRTWLYENWRTRPGLLAVAGIWTSWLITTMKLHFFLVP